MMDHTKKLFLSAWKSLLLHKLQTFLSTLGIVFAVTAVVLMMAIAEGAKQETLQQIARLGTNTIILRQANLTDDQIEMAGKHLSKGLCPEDVQLIGYLPDVAAVEPVREIQAKLVTAKDSDPPVILGTTPGFAELKGLEIRAGRFLCTRDMKQKAQVCVIGADIEQMLQTNRLGSSLHLEQRSFTVVGVLARRGQSSQGKSTLAARNYDRTILIPATTWPEDIGYGLYSEINVKLHNEQNLSLHGRALERIMLRNRNGFKDFEVVIPKELLHQAQKTQRTFNMVLGCIAGISLLVGGIGIMNIMIASVTERTKEIGIRRAIGASKEHIIRQFLTEAVLLTCSGGIIGIMTGIAGAVAVAWWADWPIAISFWSVTLALGMSLGTGIFFGFYPAKKAADLDPIASLRFE